VFPEDGKSMAISVAGKRILKSGIWREVFDREGGILNIKNGQKSGISVSDFLQKGSITPINISDFVLVEM